jgi:hypothetical protein
MPGFSREMFDECKLLLDDMLALKMEAAANG